MRKGAERGKKKEEEEEKEEGVELRKTEQDTSNACAQGESCA